MVFGEDDWEESSPNSVPLVENILAMTDTIVRTILPTNKTKIVFASWCRSEVGCVAMSLLVWRHGVLRRLNRLWFLRLSLVIGFPINKLSDTSGDTSESRSFQRGPATPP
jgi:hypothetical protein